MLKLKMNRKIEIYYEKNPISIDFTKSDGSIDRVQFDLDRFDSNFQNEAIGCLILSLIKIRNSNIFQGDNLDIAYKAIEEMSKLDIPSIDFLISSTYFIRAITELNAVFLLSSEKFLEKSAKAGFEEAELALNNWKERRRDAEEKIFAQRG